VRIHSRIGQRWEGAESLPSPTLMKEILQETTVGKKDRSGAQPTAACPRLTRDTVPPVGEGWRKIKGKAKKCTSAHTRAHIASERSPGVQ